jgi:hypothetical protein
MNPNPTPPQKPNAAPQQTQPINKDVMDLVANKGQPKSSPEVEQAKQRLLKVIQTSGADPQKIILAGKYAMEAVRKPEMYQMALDVAVKNGILTPDQLPKGQGIDYGLLQNGIAAGKLTQELMKEGKL